jgi:hypothetical protein
MKADRFDLEEQITNLHNFVCQIDLLNNAILNDTANELTKDNIANALGGLSVLLNIHIGRIYDTMCEVLDLDGIV